MYVQPIGDIIHKHELKYHQYADDLQLFCHFPLDALSLSTAVHRTEQCIDELKDWMTANYLQMNDSKSEILPVIPRHKTGTAQGLGVCVGSDYVTAVRHVKNLGVYLNSFPLILRVKAACFHLTIKVLLHARVLTLICACPIFKANFSH